MNETSHDARSGIFFTVDGAFKGWYARGVIIKYLTTKDWFSLLSWEQWLGGVSHYVLSHKC